MDWKQKHQSIITKIFIMFLLVGLIAVAFGSVRVFAENGDAKNIRVGFFNFAGYHDIDDDGTKSGYGYDFIQMIARYDNDNYTFVGYDKGWNDMFPMLDHGEIDMLTNVAKTADREEKYLFSDKTIGSDGSLFTVRDDNATVISGDYSTYDGLKIGAIKDSVQVNDFKNFAAQHQFSYTMQTFDTEGALSDALQSGQIDGAVAIGLRNIQHEKVIDQIKTSEMYVVVRKSDQALMDQINRAIDRLDQESANWRSELFSKYYQADQGDNISFLADELEYINQLKDENKVLTVAVNPDRKPYSYYKDGKIEGIIPRIFEKVANRVGIKYKISAVKTRQAYQDLLASGMVDICLDEIYAPYEAGEAGFKITDPYLSASIARIVSTDFNGQIKTVAKPKNTDLKTSVENQLYADVQIVDYDSTQACIDAVKSGTVDAAYVYSYVAQIAINEDPENKISMNILMDYDDEFAIGVPKNQDYHLIAILNKGINSIEKSTIQNIINDETDYQMEAIPVSTYIKYNPWIFATFIVVLISIIGLVVVLVLRMRNINAIKEEEEKKNALLREKNEQEAEFVQAMTYVCKTNELVRNTNLDDRTITDYFLEDGQLKTKVQHYTGFDLANHNQIFHPDDYKQVVPRFDEDKARYLTQHGGGEEYFECRSKNAAGEYQWYGYTMQAVPCDSAHPCNFIVYKKDINEAKLEELKDRQNLEDALKLAKNASAAKGQFMSRMSHEIRTPLNAVLGYIAIAKTSSNDMNKVMNCLDNSETAAKHLLSIINDVLDISAIESGKLKIAATPFNLKEELMTLYTVFGNQAKTKGIDLTMDMATITQEWVVGDALRLNQIMMNLLSNAIKFTDAGGHVKLIAKQVKHSEDRAMYQFEVSDDGIGMSEDYQKRLYQSFEQETAETAVKYGGSGLGLSITKNLVTMMNGSIEVKSEVGKGTTFTVVMELAEAKANGRDRRRAKPFGKRRVLCIEDDDNTAKAITQVLKGYGIRAEVVPDATRAARKIDMRQASDYMYDLCIWDRSEGTTNEQNELSIPVEFITRPFSQSELYNLLVKHFGGADSAKPETETTNSLAGIRVLLAEDNPMNMDIANTILTNADIIVEGVSNGQAAVDAFNASEPGYYQVILMDIQMPIMDGYEATRQIRKSLHVDSVTIPILAMTANAFTEDVSAALSAGMNDHISKPINFDKLYASLNHVLPKN